MRRARILLRSLALAVVTGVLELVWLLGWPVAWLLRSHISWTSTVFQLWARCTAWIVGMRMSVKGVLPEQPFLLVANHLGYMDIVLLAAHTRCVFVAKSEVSQWPVIGFLARCMGTLFIDRGRTRDVTRVATDIEASLRRGQSVVVFPEGTSSDGADVGSFRSSLLEPAARAGLPVQYASIRYATPDGETPARLAVSWWGDMTFAPHLVQMLGLPSFGASLDFSGTPIRDSDRKSLARRLHAAVSERFVPMTEGLHV